jgi:hypothetical protein
MTRSKPVSALRWVESDGGPLVAMDAHALPRWQGVDAPADGRVVQATSRFDDPGAPATDYDSACDATDTPRFFGRVARADIDVLALNRGPKCWRPLRDGVVIVAWEHGPSEESVNAQLVKAFPAAAGTEPALGGGPPAPYSR